MIKPRSSDPLFFHFPSFSEPSKHWLPVQYPAYRKTSDISRTLVDNNIVDHSDVFGASPVGAAPTIYSFST